MLLAQIEDAVEIIRMEYAEFPGLRLTFWQTQRLCGLSEGVCASALQRLTDGRFLCQAPDGAYVRGTWPDRPLASSRDEPRQLRTPA